MKKIFLAFVLLLFASPAWGTIASVGVFGKANTASSGTTLVITTTATLEVGNLAVIGIGADNTNTTDGDFDEIASVVDSAGNTWSKICEFTNGQGAAAAGATGAAWMTRATSQLTSGGTITITLATARNAKVAVAHEFTVGANVQVAGSCLATASDAIDPPSMTISDLPEDHTLFIRFHMKENAATDDFVTLTAGYSAFGFAKEAGPGGSGNLKVAGEYIITTATGSTSDPADDGDNDGVNLFFALREVPDAFKRPRQVIMIGD